MAPQRRGLVPKDHLARITALRQILDDTQHQLEQAVADALKTGASVRELAKATGLSSTTIQKYGHAHGWPSETQRRAWAEQKAARDEFTARMEAANALLRHLGEDPDE